MNDLNPAIFENLVALRTKMLEKGNEPFTFLYHRQDLATISGIGFELDHDSLLKNDYMDLLLKDKFCYLRIKGCHQVMKIDSLLQCTFVCIC